MGAKQPVSGLQRDARVNDSYAIKYKKDIASYKGRPGSSGGFYFTLVVADRTGDIPLKFWGGPDEQHVRRLHAIIKEGDVISVNGSVSEYNGQLEIHVNDIPGALVPVAQFNVQEFIPSSERNLDEMLAEYCAKADAITDPTCKVVLRALLTDDVKKKLLLAPAATSVHHARLGGLLEHTLQLVALCECICPLYPRLNRELLVTGALIHDLGKIEEYELKGAILATPLQALVGHISLLAGRIMTLKGATGVDDVMLMKIAHLIVSHHGMQEWGSPKSPAIPEALVLSQIDKMDANIDRMQFLIDDIAKGKTFARDKDTFYDKTDERTIYLK